MEWQRGQHPDSLQALRCEVDGVALSARTIGEVVEQVEQSGRQWPVWLVVARRGRVELGRAIVLGRHRVDAAAAELLSACTGS